MSLGLTCLGGAAAWPNPGQGCSSYLVQSAGTSIVLDAGSNTLLELRKHVDYRTVDAVVISHCHSDHILDLVPYRYGLTYGPEPPSTRIALWLPPGGRRVLDALANALAGQGEANSNFWDGAFDVREYDPTEPLVIGSLTLTFARTVHPAECYAMRLESEDGGSLVYTADTGTVDSVLDLARGCDVLIAEGTMPEDSGKPGAEIGHLTPSEAGDLAARASAGTLIVTHLWYERPEAEVVAAVRRSFHRLVLIARPGLTVHV